MLHCFTLYFSHTEQTSHIYTQAARCRRWLGDAAHVPQTDRAETPLGLFIYFCSFLVMKIYDRTFATSRRLFTQANMSVETMILVLKDLRFSHYRESGTAVCLMSLSWGGASSVAAFDWLEPCVREGHMGH